MTMLRQALAQRESTEKQKEAIMKVIGESTRVCACVRVCARVCACVRVRTRARARLCVCVCVCVCVRGCRSSALCLAPN